MNLSEEQTLIRDMARKFAAWRRARSSETARPAFPPMRSRRWVNSA